MADREVLAVNSDLLAAYREISGTIGDTPAPALVLAAGLELLAKGYGLSDSRGISGSQLEHARIPDHARALLAAVLLVAPDLGDGDAVRDSLYQAFVAVSGSLAARRVLNESEPLDETGVLKLAQVYWNLEATEVRRLPIPSGLPIEYADGSAKVADIRADDANVDLATEKWSDRCRRGASGLGKAGAFRKKGARLAVLVAQYLVGTSDDATALLGPCRLSLREAGSTQSAEIVWQDDEFADKPSDRAFAEEQVPPVSEMRNPRTSSTAGVIRIGKVAEVGTNYQTRGFDGELERVWREVDDKRIWLTGGPGVGKSFAARRMAQKELARESESRVELVIWVDAADAGNTMRSFVDAQKALGERLEPGFTSQSASVEADARDFLERLATSDWRWLVVLDNANVTELIEQQLLPPGFNPNGRVLVTTTTYDHRLHSHGTVVRAGTYSDQEADGYLLASGYRALAGARPAQRAELVRTLGSHPLALSIAAATIAANSMTIEEWLGEFAGAGSMDSAADVADPGGYGRLIAGTWSVAVDRAAIGVPRDIVKRAALVAAVSAPEGHPTWLWDMAPVVSWVGGAQGLVRRHGRPAAVTNLIDNGLLTLNDGDWRNGSLSMHQLASRAIVESSAPEEVAELASLLVEQWLIGFVAHDSTQILENIRHLFAAPGLPERERKIAAALMGWARPQLNSQDEADSLDLASEESNYRELVDSEGGNVSRASAMIAHQAMVVAREFNRVGNAGEALEWGKCAIDRYASVLALRDLDGLARAALLVDLGRAREFCGTLTSGTLSGSEAGQDEYLEAMALYLECTADDPADKMAWQLLANLYVLLGRKREALEARMRWYALVPDNVDEAAAAVVREMVRTASQPNLEPRVEALLSRAAVERRTRSAREGWLGLDVDSIRASGGWSLQTDADLDDLVWEHASELDDLAEFELGVGLLEVGLDHWRSAQVGSPQGWRLRALAESLAEDDDWESIESTWRRELEDPVGREDSAGRADCYVVLAGLAVAGGRREVADSDIGSALSIYARAAGGRPFSAVMGPLRFLDSRWQEAAERADWATASATATRRLARLQEEFGSEPGSHEEVLANGFETAAISQNLAGEYGKAIESASSAAAIRGLLSNLDPDDDNAQRDHTKALKVLAMAQSGAEQQSEALRTFEECLEIQLKVLENDEASAVAANEVADTLKLMAWTYQGMGEIDEAEALYRCAIDLRGRIAGDGADDQQPASDLSGDAYGLGKLLLKSGDAAGAKVMLGVAVEGCRSLVGYSEFGIRGSSAFVEALVWYGMAAFMDGPDLASAERAISEALPIARAEAAVAPDSPETQMQLGFALAVFSGLQSENRDNAGAQESLRDATAIAELMVELGPGQFESQAIVWLQRLADLHREVGQFAEADEVSARAAEIERRLTGESDNQD